jgi:hypothetical protein
MKLDVAVLPTCARTFVLLLFTARLLITYAKAAS